MNTVSYTSFYGNKELSVILLTAEIWEISTGANILTNTENMYIVKGLAGCNEVYVASLNSSSLHTQYNSELSFLSLGFTSFNITSL
jgi:hypothetical protein